MNRFHARTLLPAALVAMLVAGCQRDEASAPADPSSPTDPAVRASADAPVLKDVVETTPAYIIGISYPPSASRYPALAAEIRRYAERARTELIDAARSRDAKPGSAPYDLSLAVTEVHVSPGLVAYAADGTSYTGGAHGAPLVARWTWLPRENRLLRATDLVPTPSGWQAVSAYVREQLRTALAQRVDADALEAGERENVMRSAGRMIDDGTAADPANFDLFEPVVRPDGTLAGLRFVFAPYQVGPYSDGTQTVEVPAAVLLPHVAAPYRGMFAAG